MITVQALVNFAVVTGLFHQGTSPSVCKLRGSALLINMAAVGILLRISRGDEEKTIEEDGNIKVRKIARRNIYSRKGYSN